MFELAFKGKGLAINPFDLPYDIQCILPEWHDEMIEADNERHKQAEIDAKNKTKKR